MHRCLIVGNQTLGGPRLAEAVQERLPVEGAEFYVVVPATPIGDQELGPGPGPNAGPSPQERAYALARQRLDGHSTSSALWVRPWTGRSATPTRSRLLDWRTADWARTK
jgi:hypothetical protein